MSRVASAAAEHRIPRATGRVRVAADISVGTIPGLTIPVALARNRIPGPLPQAGPVFPAQDGGCASRLQALRALTPKKDFPPCAGNPRKRRALRYLIPKRRPRPAAPSEIGR